MSRKLFTSAVGIVVLVSLGLVIAGLAQAFQLPAQPPKTLSDHLNDIGTSIFGGADPPPSAEQPYTGASGPPAPRSGASPVMRPTLARTSPSAASNTYRQPAATPIVPTYARPTAQASAPTTVRRPTPAPSQPAVQSSSGARLPLHERLRAFQQSGGAGGAVPSATVPQPAGPPQPTHAAEPEKVRVSTPRTAPISDPIGSNAGAPVPTRAPSSEVPVRPQRLPTEDPPAERPTPAPVQPTPVAKAPVTRAPVGHPTPAASPMAPSSGGDRVLFKQRSPVLGVETIGPRKITVGKESIYEMTIRNSGDVDADEVVVTVAVPKWAEVLGAEASTGATYSSSPDAAAGSFRWKVGRLSAKGQEKLSLRIVPRESRPFDLAVTWDYTPAASQAMIEVQEPKLAIRLDGPREVLYGERQLYQLLLSNPGTGDAENVSITLYPIGKENQPATHGFGTVRAGEEKKIAVELTARQTGHVAVRVTAQADGGLRAEVTEQIVVHRAELLVEVEGPAVQFVGAEADYRIRVRNTGNAAASNLRLTATIPAGAKYISASDDAVLEANGTKVTWNLDKFGIGVERAVDLQCEFDAPGTLRLEATANADQGLSESAATTTRVDAMADLVLEVVDPTGPVAVGAEAEYEIHVENRGTKNAQNVEVIACFSRGIDPTSVTGGLHRIHDGQILFNPLPSVDAGKKVVLKIRARAKAPGNHIFRAEVFCKPLGTRLASEETTHYYEDRRTAQRSSTSEAEASAADEYSPPAQTADRRATLGETPPDSVPSADTDASPPAAGTQTP